MLGTERLKKRRVNSKTVAERGEAARGIGRQATPRPVKKKSGKSPAAMKVRYVVSTRGKKGASGLTGWGTGDRPGADRRKKDPKSYGEEEDGKGARIARAHT